MAHTWSGWIALLSVSASSMACGEAPPPPAAAPTAAPSPSPPAQAVSAEPVADPPVAPVAQAEPVKPVAAEDTSLKPTQKPREILTGASTMFFLQFDASDPGKTASEKCKSETDEAKRAGCVQKIREKLQADAMKFRKDVNGKYVWHSMLQKGEQFLFSHKVPVEFAEETDRSIVLRPKGADTGVSPWAVVPKEVKIEVQNDFTITVIDPHAGRLVYEAKIGMEGQ